MKNDYFLGNRQKSKNFSYKMNRDYCIIANIIFTKTFDLKEKINDFNYVCLPG